MTGVVCYHLTFTENSSHIEFLATNLELLMDDILMGLQDLSHCTTTGFRTLENKHKTLVFKDLRRIWEKYDSSLPWEKGIYNESNTLLLDDSPYKALLNPVRFHLLFVFDLA